ncbi:MAG TPA: hypothetical protein VD905_10125, partial [Flavobacteriales bacterium]|nr:hypothetical protein [Flavobacteriales bacterium]
MHKHLAYGLFVVMLASCGITKRHYRTGFYFPHQGTVENTVSEKKNESFAKEKTAIETERKEEVYQATSFVQERSYDSDNEPAKTVLKPQPVFRNRDIEPVPVKTEKSRETRD